MTALILALAASLALNLLLWLVLGGERRVSQILADELAGRLDLEEAGREAREIIARIQGGW
jgi:hypothetical protein